MYMCMDHAGASVAHLAQNSLPCALPMAEHGAQGCPVRVSGLARYLHMPSAGLPFVSVYFTLSLLPSVFVVHKWNARPDMSHSRARRPSCARCTS